MASRMRRARAPSSDVVEHEARGEEEGARIGDALPRDVRAPFRAPPRRSPRPSPMFAPGARPSPPTRPEMRSDRMSPNRFVVTMTSNARA